MRIEDAKLLAEKVTAALSPMCECIQVAGSIRRGRAEVGDIDIVAIPKATVAIGPLCGPVSFPEDSVWKLLFPKELKKAGLKVEEAGPELQRYIFTDGFQVDIYRARPETWGVILLVRTGSKEHNVKLCSLAKRFASSKYPYGVRLSAAQGVIAVKADGSDGAVIASRSEEDIFAALGLAFVKPENREALPF